MPQQTLSIFLIVLWILIYIDFIWYLLINQYLLISFYNKNHAKIFGLKILRYYTNNLV